MDEEFRRLQIQQDRIKSNSERRLEAKQASELNVQDLRKRAKAYIRMAPSAKVSISHLGRVSKNAKLYQKNRQFQLMYDFEGLAREISLEKKKVYVDPEAYHLL